MKNEDVVAAIQLLQRRLDEAYDDDSAQILITRENVSLDGPEGDILIDGGTAEQVVDQVIETAKSK